LKPIVHFLGLDRAIAYTLFGRGWTALSGVVTLFFISKWLNPHEQGFYYTFTSLLALQVIFELGLNSVVIQFTSHEMAKMFFTHQGTLDGDSVSKSRLRSLFILVIKWYGVSSLLILILIFPLGWSFFSGNEYKSLVSWQVPWFFLIIGTALNILIVPLFSILEGCGKIAEVAKLRLIQGVLGALLLWILLMNKFCLMAAPIVNICIFCIAVVYIFSKYRLFFGDLMAFNQTDKVSWKHEIFPFQWKVAVSWLSGYLMLQLFVPIIFFISGPSQAGQMGLSLSVASAILGLSISWVNTKAPLFGMLVVQKKFDLLDQVFLKSLIQSSFVIIVISIFVYATNIYLVHKDYSLVHRSLPLLPFFFLLLTTVLNNLLFAQSIYLRAFKNEGFMWLYVIIGILVTTSSFVLGPIYGVLGMMICYFVITLVFGFCFGLFVFSSKRKELLTK